MGALLEPRCAAREVVDDVGLALFQAVYVDHVDVGLAARRQHPAILQAKHPRRFAGDASHRFLERIGALVAVPVREHEGGPAGVDHLAHVGAGVAEARQRPVRGDEQFEVLEIDVEAAVVEQRLALALQRQAQPRLHRMFASGIGDVGEALVARLGVVRPRILAHGVVALGGLQDLLVELLVVAHVGHQLGAEVRIRDGGEAFLEAHLAQFVPVRRAPEVACRKAADAAAGAGHGDGRDVHAGIAHGAHLLVENLPVLADGAEQHAARLALGRKQIHLVLDLAEVRHGLHEAALGADRLGNRQHLGARREGAGNGPAIRQGVAGMPIHGEAQGALGHGRARQGGDLADFVLGGLFLDGALAHHVEARRAVPHEAADVDHRLQAFDGVQIAAVGFPIPGQAGEDGVLRNVLDGFHHAGEELPVLRPARGEGDAAVAEQGGGDAMPGHRRHVRIPADLGIEMGVQIDEAGRDGMAGGVDLLLAGLRHCADRGDRIAVNGDVNFLGRIARAVHDEAVADYQIMSQLDSPCGWVRRPLCHICHRLRRPGGAALDGCSFAGRCV